MRSVTIRAGVALSFVFIALFACRGVGMAEAGEAPAAFSLIVGRAGTGNGTVVAPAGGIDCGTVCTMPYYTGTTLVLVATPSGGSTFVGWSGDADCLDGMVTMTAERRCVATFNDNGTTPPIRKLSLATNDLVYDPHSGRLLASIRPDVPNVGNTIATIDATSGSVLSYQYVGDNPTKLALSDDGHYLYVALDGVGSVRRIDLLSGSLEAPFSLGSDVYGSFQVDDMAVQPGNPAVLAVSRMHSAMLPRHAGVAVYDNGVQRPTVASGYTGSNAIEFGASGTTLYGYCNETSDFNFRKMTLDASGVTVTNVTRNLIGGTGADIRFAANRIYSTTGRVVDPDNATLVGTFPRPGLVAPEPSAGLVFFFDTAASRVVAYSSTSYRPLWEFYVPDAGANPSDLVRWGADGLAFRSDAAVFIVDLSGWTRPPLPSTLRIHIAGTGSGAASSADGLIRCGSDCSAEYPVDSVVALYTTSAAGSTFTGWTGDPGCASGVLNMSTAHECTANFAAAGVAPRLTRVALKARDLAFNSSDGRLYVSVPGADRQLGNSIVTIDPETGHIERAIPAGSEPSHLALSDDNTALYVSLEGAGGFSRLDLSTLAFDPPVSFGNDPINGPLIAWQLRVGPGRPDLMVASVGGLLSAYSGGTKLPSTVSSYGDAQFSDVASVMYAAATGTIKRIAVEADGLHVGATVGTFPELSDQMVFDSRRLYFVTGQVIDPTTGSMLAQLGVQNYGVKLCAPDSSAKNVTFTWTSSADAFHPVLAKFDSSTFALVWTIPLQTGGSMGYAYPRHMVKWGTHGVAFVTDDGVLLVDYAPVENIRTLNVKRGGFGSGTVSAPGLAASDVNSYTGQYEVGTSVTLQATPEFGSYFSGWSGDAGCSNVVTMKTGLSCIANFSPVGTAPQSIIATTPAPARAVFNTSFTVAGTATSGLPVTYSSGSPTVCTNVGATFTMLTGTGNCLIQFNQGGDAVYGIVRMTSTVVADKARATLTLGNLTQPWDGKWKTVTVTTNPAGLTVVTVMYNGTPGPPIAAGTYSVVASLTNPNYYAPDVTGVLTIGSSRAVSDFTADGKSDVLWRHATRGEVWVWPMNGASPTATTWVQTLADVAWEIRGVPDMTGDGMPDILWRRKSTGEIAVWPMNGTTPGEAVAVATVSPAYDIVGIGDFNGDGKPDLLWRNLTNGEVWIWLMDGTTPIREVYLDTIDPGYVIKGVGDLDGDGKADIVWHHATRGEVWVWLMDGTTVRSRTNVATVADTGYQIQGLADFTGDGKADILWRHTTRGEVWLWTMNGATLSAASYVWTVPDTNYRIVATGDYDGDGRAGVLWHHATRGEVWVWVMNGPNLQSQACVGVVSDVGYQIAK